MTFGSITTAPIEPTFGSISTAYKVLLPVKNFLRDCRFLFLSFFYFHRTLFVTPGVNPGIYNNYLKHSFSTYTCLSNNLLISAWISTKFVSTLLLCMLYRTKNFQHKANTSMYLRDTFTLYVDSFQNSDPL